MSILDDKNIVSSSLIMCVCGVCVENDACEVLDEHVCESSAEAEDKLLFL